MTTHPAQRRHLSQTAILTCFGGALSFAISWMLTSVHALQPLLFAPLIIINRCAWAILGAKLFPDGNPSTLFVSCCFFLFGALVALWALRDRAAKHDL